MTYQEFKNKYNGKGVDYDKMYGNQCWDLAQQYFVEVLKLPSSVLSGCGLVSNMLKGNKYKLMLKYFDVIPDNKMKAGDVVIWEYGHIAIYDHWNEKEHKRYYFSQNPNLPKVMSISTGGWHTFRLKAQEEKKYGTPINRNEEINQVEVVATELNGRSTANGTKLGIVNKGIYNILDEESTGGYLWVKIEEDLWIATKEDIWTKFYYKKEELPIKAIESTPTTDETIKVEETITEEVNDKHSAIKKVLELLINLINKIFKR